jgi:uncharacterized protein (TIGR00251 family)
LPRSSIDTSAAPPWRRIGSDGSITLTIRAQPGAKRSEIAGVVGGELKIRLAAWAAEGKANAALLALLADAFGVPRQAVTLLRGATSRRKVVRVAAPRRRPDRAWANS